MYRPRHHLLRKLQHLDLDKSTFDEICTSFIHLTPLDGSVKHFLSKCNDHVVLHQGRRNVVLEGNSNYGLVFKCIRITPSQASTIYAEALSEIYITHLFLDTPVRNFRLITPESLVSTQETLVLSYKHAGVPLSTWLSLNKSDLNTVYTIWTRLLDCMSELHVLTNSAHLAIDPSHIMVNPITTSISLISLRQIQRGISQHHDHTYQTPPASRSRCPVFTPPESSAQASTLQTMNHLKAYDIWTLGAVFRYIAHECASSEKSFLANFCVHPTEIELKLEMLNSMMNVNPMKRPSISEVTFIFNETLYKQSEMHRV